MIGILDDFSEFKKVQNDFITPCIHKISVIFLRRMDLHKYYIICEIRNLIFKGSWEKKLGKHVLCRYWL